MRLILLLGATLLVVGASLSVGSVALANHDATALPHGGNGSGQPYFGGQIKNNNYTYYVTERDTGMDNWATKTGRRYIDGWVSGQVMTQYVVYSGSQQDTDLATWFGTPTCQSFGLFGFNAFHFGHGSLNNDKFYSVICLGIVAYGYSPGYDSLSLPTRKKGHDARDGS